MRGNSRYFGILEDDGDISRVNIFRRADEPPSLVAVLYAPDAETAQDLLGFAPTRFAPLARRGAPDDGAGRLERRIASRDASSSVSGLRRR